MSSVTEYSVRLSSQTAGTSIMENSVLLPSRNMRVTVTEFSITLADHIKRDNYMEKM